MLGQEVHYLDLSRPLYIMITAPTPSPEPSNQGETSDYRSLCIFLKRINGEQNEAR
jgi:hypothetical protein